MSTVACLTVSLPARDDSFPRSLSHLSALMLITNRSDIIYYPAMGTRWIIYSIFLLRDFRRAESATGESRALHSAIFSRWIAETSLTERQKSENSAPRCYLLAFRGAQSGSWIAYNFPSKSNGEGGGVFTHVSVFPTRDEAWLRRSKRLSEVRSKNWMDLLFLLRIFSIPRGKECMAFERVDATLSEASRFSGE